MKILSVDIGTGTQDIYLYDSRFDLENGLKLIVPSPTMIVHHRLREATRQRAAVLITGVTMGGGPSQWAAEDHIRAGLPIYATPEAARTFNDELEAVEAMGVRILGEDEALSLPEGVHRLELCDFNFLAIARALEQFGVNLDDLDVVAVAVFDHGNSPPGYSDRQFRFDYLNERICTRARPGAQSPLSAFAYRAEDIPPIMTRLQAVASSAQGIDVPLVVMDSAPAAILGATFDPQVGAMDRILIVNVGNFHTLAFRIGLGKIEAVFEHHTGMLDLSRLETLLYSLAVGELKHSDVFNDHGHGALIYNPQPLSLTDGDFGIAVTGPRRNLMRNSSLRPYFAVPFGDMMLAGCFGLLAAVADIMPELEEPIHASLCGVTGCGKPPWEIN